MKKKIFLTIAGLLMLAIIIVGGSNLSTIYKNYAQFICFAGIAICVYMVMHNRNNEDKV